MAEKRPISRTNSKGVMNFEARHRIGLPMQERARRTLPAGVESNYGEAHSDERL